MKSFEGLLFSIWLLKICLRIKHSDGRRVRSDQMAYTSFKVPACISFSRR